MKEADLTKAVIDLAHSLGWKVAHFPKAQGSDGRWRTALAGDAKGWPDLILCHPSNGMVPYAWELKVGSNKPSDEQIAWLELLGAVGMHAVVRTDRDWASGLIERELRREG